MPSPKMTLPAKQRNVGSKIPLWGIFFFPSDRCTLAFLKNWLYCKFCKTNLILTLISIMSETFSQIFCSYCLVVMTVQTRREGRSELLKGQLSTWKGWSNKQGASSCRIFLNLSGGMTQSPFQLPQPPFPQLPWIWWRGKRGQRHITERCQIKAHFCFSRGAGAGGGSVGQEGQPWRWPG